MKNLLHKFLPQRTRSRCILAGCVGALVLLSSLAAIDNESGESELLATAQVQRGPLTISLVESGTIRPRQQIILTNEMDDPAAIVSIAPEGSLVKKGDLLVELNASEAENDLLERRIRVQNSESELVYARENLSVVLNQGEADIEQAELDLRFARQDLEKYLKGEYPMELMTLESKINVAEEELKQANEQLRWSRILAEEKYLSQAELERDELSTRKVQLDLDLARRNLEVFKQYTHERQLAEFESAVNQSTMALERIRLKAAANIAQAEAELRACEAKLEEEYARLRRVEAEIARAKMYAPIDGMVLYASSVSNDWRDDEDRIQEGAMVKKRGEIIYLPTANTYDADIQIPEASLGKVRPGQPVRLTTDARPGETFSGRIARVARLPDARSRYLNPNLKLYNVVIELDPIEAELRNGMSCRAEIRIGHYDDATYVPIQSIARYRGKPVVHVLEGSRTRPVEVELGLDNNRVVQIASGVSEGQQILLAPPFDAEPPTTEEEWGTEVAEPADTAGASAGGVALSDAGSHPDGV